MNPSKETLQVSEIFYSLQGEGSRAGTPDIFIRLQGCKAKFACAKMGIVCDTEFESGKQYTVLELSRFIKKFNCRSIVWTGGEPAPQLSKEIISYFKEQGYFQSIETSGLFPVHDLGLDYVSLSPKVAEHIIEKNFPNGVNELRYVRHEGQEVPQPSITAQHYYISPHSDGWSINTANLKHCVNLCLNSPKWKLSIQLHKVWNVL